MAERRMFAKTIIDSDAFLEMSLSTQALYFHLAMRADDDGFLNNAKKIMRIVGANQNDYDVLVSKRFILQFEDGICVIKHWRIHNYIQNDRYKPTIYQDEMSMLGIKKNKSYTLSQTPVNMPIESECIQDVSKLDSQDRLGKDRLGKDRLGKDRLGKDRGRIDYQQIADMYNNTCVSFPKLKSLSDARKKSIKARMKTYSVEDFQTVFQKAEDSSFLKGNNSRNWSANFDWMIKDANMAKILDGNYDNKGVYSNEQTGRCVRQADSEPSYTDEELERAFGNGKGL